MIDARNKYSLQTRILECWFGIRHATYTRAGISLCTGVFNIVLSKVIMALISLNHYIFASQCQWGLVSGELFVLYHPVNGGFANI